MSCKPLGKTSMSHTDFSAGVSTTQATRHRGGGASHANSNPSRRGSVGWTTPGNSNAGIRNAGNVDKGNGHTSPGRRSK